MSNAQHLRVCTFLLLLLTSASASDFFTKYPHVYMNFKRLTATVDQALQAWEEAHYHFNATVRDIDRAIADCRAKANKNRV